MRAIGTMMPVEVSEWADFSEPSSAWDESDMDCRRQAPQVCKLVAMAPSCTYDLDAPRHIMCRDAFAGGSVWSVGHSPPTLSDRPDVAGQAIVW